MHTTIYRPARPTPQRKPRRRSWKRLVGGGLLIAIAIYISLVSWLAPVQAIAGKAHFGSFSQSDATVPLAWPTYGQAAVGATGYGMLDTHGSIDTPLATASTAKTITALAVLQKHPLQPNSDGPILTMTQQDVAFYHYQLTHDGSLITVRAGQQLTERQALEAMLLRSANNMADTLAVWAFGSLPAYHDYATAMIHQLGLQHTTIGVDASGLDPSTTSTADDLVRLGLHLMANPALAGIVGQKTAVIPEVGTIHNTNTLLGMQGIIGIKTGNNDQDKGAYLFAADHQVAGGKTVRIIGAIMGASSLSQAKHDSLGLLASTEAGFQPRQLFHAGEVVGSYTAPWSAAAVNASVKTDVTTIGWRGQPLNLRLNLKDVTAPVAAGTIVGTISAGASGHQKIIGTVVLDRAIGQPGTWWRLTHPFQKATAHEQQ